MHITRTISNTSSTMTNQQRITFFSVFCFTIMCSVHVVESFVVPTIISTNPRRVGVNIPTILQQQQQQQEQSIHEKNNHHPQRRVNQQVVRHHATLKENDFFSTLPRSVLSSVVGCLIGFGSFFPTTTTSSTNWFHPSVANAVEMEGSRVVGTLKGSGLVFKDTLQIESFDDPKVQGVKLYISTFQIPLTERFGKNLFTDPSYASVACARRNAEPVKIASNIARGPNGEEVFEEKKSLLFKELRVYRIYDEPANTIVYVSFNTRLDKGDDSNKSRFKSSLCAINLDDNPIVAAPSTPPPPATTTATATVTATP